MTSSVGGVSSTSLAGSPFSAEPVDRTIAAEPLLAGGIKTIINSSR